MAISKGIGEGTKAVMCAATGNTSASASAYRARADWLYVLIPAGKIALGKLSQAHDPSGNGDPGRRQFRPGADDRKRVIRYLIRELVNPMIHSESKAKRPRLSEVCDQLGDAPSLHILPGGECG